MRNYFFTVFLAVTLSACGGGSGGGGGTNAGSGSQVGVRQNPAAVFTPNKVIVSVDAGNSRSVVVSASITNPADFANTAAVFAYIVDDVGVILPQAQITQTSGTTYSATLQTSSSLKVGTYTGNFSLKVCRDSGCVNQFPGFPVLLPYEITITPPPPAPISVSSDLPLSFTIRQGTAVSATTQISVKTGGRAWTASSDVSWLKLSGAANSGDASFQISYDVSGLPVGQYTANVTVLAADGAKSIITAGLTVQQAAFQIAGTGLIFNAINGAPISPQSVQFNIDNDTPTKWSATSNANWLTADPVAGLTPATTTLRVNPAQGAFASGTYSAKLTFSSPLVAPREFDVVLNLSKPTLALSTNNVTLGGLTGRQFSDAVFTMNLNTGANAWPWTLSGTPDWLKPSALSGNVDQNGVSIGLAPIAALAPIGTSSVMLNVGAKVNGDVLNSPLTVTINKDQRKLLVAEPGIALSSTPNWSRLSRTIKVRDNMGLATSWSASSDQSWLTVSSSGSTASGTAALTVSADPSALPTNQMSYATVTLRTNVSGVQVPETVAVAIWKGSTTPSSNVTLPKAYSNVIGDPIRPFAYLHNAGSEIDVYNLYTGTKISTISGVGASLGDMAISPNGDTLYVFDTANRIIVLVDLASLSKRTTWPISAAVNSQSRLLATHPNGVNVVLTNGGLALLAPNGIELENTSLYGEFAVSADGSRLFAQATEYTPSTVGGYALDFSAAGGGKLRLVGDSGAYASGYGIAIAANVDGSRVYVAEGYPYRCIAFSGKDLSEIGQLPGGDTYPNNVRVGSDGRVYCGISGRYSPADIWVHGADGSLQKTIKIADYAKALLPRQMALSGDGLMLIALTDDPRSVIVPVGP